MRSAYVYILLLLLGSTIQGLSQQHGAPSTDFINGCFKLQLLQSQQKFTALYTTVL